MENNQTKKSPVEGGDVGEPVMGSSRYPKSFNMVAGIRAVLPIENGCVGVAFDMSGANAVRIIIPLNLLDELVGIISFKDEPIRLSSVNSMLIRALRLSEMEDDCVEGNYFWACYAKALSDILNGAGQGAAEKDGLSLEDQQAIIERGITALPDNLKRMKAIIRDQRLKALGIEGATNSHSDSEIKFA